MNTHEIVNLIVSKFGGNRVKFDLVSDLVVDFILGHNLYRVCWVSSLNRLTVWKHDGETFNADDQYCSWVEGILNNMVRNEAGEMVAR
jgi:hypothetical protein